MNKIYNFGEKKTEWSAKQGKEIPVYLTPGYQKTKLKAIEIIESEKYGLDENDFWILMNEAKNSKMAYTGLIISHNACLKINDHIEDKFDPDSVIYEKDGYSDSLVFHYCNSKQGIYEVGEVSKGNCKNSYPYAMAFKRLFDRVVLKLSKIAFYGVYSEAEADEFKNPNTEREKTEYQKTVEQMEEYKPKEMSLEDALKYPLLDSTIGELMETEDGRNFLNMTYKDAKTSAELKKAIKTASKAK